MSNTYAPLIRKLVRFGLVGTLVTGSYALVTYSGVRYLYLSPQGANLLGCFVAIVLSYTGQKYFTFRSARGHRVELPRFLVVCVLAVLASSASVACAQGAGLDYRIGILGAAIVIPLCNFVVLNLWVFATRDQLKQ